VYRAANFKPNQQVGERAGLHQLIKDERKLTIYSDIKPPSCHRHKAGGNGYGKISQVSTVTPDGAMMIALWITCAPFSSQIVPSPELAGLFVTPLSRNTSDRPSPLKSRSQKSFDPVGSVGSMK
jgi:hypothetical protein